jgi:hypothetical protein
MDFEEQLNALIFFHLEEHTSARELIQVMKEDDFARNAIAPKGASAEVHFQKQSMNVDLSNSSMSLCNCKNRPALCYRKKSKKARLHLGFNVNQGIPHKLFLTDGKGDERPFVHQILEPGQTGIMDRGYQHHHNFDSLQEERKHFVCRIKGNTHKTCLKQYDVDPESIVFYDAKVLLGQPGAKQTRKSLRLVGYVVDDVKYWVVPPIALILQQKTSP